MSEAFPYFQFQVSRYDTNLPLETSGRHRQTLGVVGHRPFIDQIVPFRGKKVKTLFIQSCSSVLLIKTLKLGILLCPGSSITGTQITPFNFLLIVNASKLH